ncbi:MAG: hypothetical protein MJ080_01410 [Clostridia bacterium]|nr:hypothetical protein [Clostridia bacterium]
MKKIICLVLTACMLSLLFCGCGSKEKALIGEWYNEKEKCLDVRSDGTWKLEDSYGTGKWKFLDDNETVEFTDFYGDTQETKIEEDELGESIDFGHYGRFYKDKYPSENEIQKQRLKNAVSIDPFKNIQYEISGISPYCQVTVNTQNCNDDVQRYVTFTTDKEYYKNGEKAVITATVSNENDEQSFVLKKKNQKKKINGQAEYAESITADEFNKICSELNDFVSGNVSSAMKEADNSFWSEGTVLGNRVNLYQGSIKNCDRHDAYIQVLKQDKNREIKNKLSFVYSGKYTSTNGNGNFYSLVSAINIVKYPDGTIKWGGKSLDEKDFEVEASSESVEHCVTTLVMCNSADYNISKVVF